MKFGFSYNRYTKNQQLFGNPGGAYTSITVTGGTYQGVTYSGDPFMDMVLGLSEASRRRRLYPFVTTSTRPPRSMPMDNWKVTPRLSFQLGLRYDALPHAWERNNDISNFDPNLYIPSQAPSYIASSTPGIFTGQMDPNGPGFATVNGSTFLPEWHLSGREERRTRGLVNNDYKRCSLA